MNTKQKFSKDQIVYTIPDIRPSYMRNVKVKVLAFRRGRYDIEVVEDTAGARFPKGSKVRAKEDWLTATKGSRPAKSPSTPKVPQMIKFTSGDVAVVKEGVRPSYLPGTVVKILGYRRGRYDVICPVESRISRFSGEETRMDPSWLEKTDRKFPEPEGDQRSVVPVFVVTTNFDRKTGSKGDVYKTEAQAKRACTGIDAEFYGAQYVTKAMPNPVPCVVSKSGYIFNWYWSDEERMKALRERNAELEAPPIHFAKDLPAAEVLKHVEDMRREAAAEARAEGRMS